MYAAACKSAEAVFNRSTADTAFFRNFGYGNGGIYIIQLVINIIESLITDLALSDNRNIPALTGENEQLYTRIVGILEDNVNKLSVLEADT